MSYITLESTSTFSPSTRTPSYRSARPTSTSPIVHSSEINPNHNPQQVSIGHMADVPTATSFEPKDLSENDDLCVKPLFFHRPSLTSTYDSAERIATPLVNRIWMMSKFVLCWLSAGFTTVFAGERSKCGPITHLSLCERKLGVKFISSSEEYGETRCAVFKQKEVYSSNTFRQRRIFLTASTSSLKRTSIQIL